MKFLVFIKQVPNSADIRFDHQKKTLVREGVKNEMNAYDRRAVTEAVRYRDERGGEVIAATMGPPSSADALREAAIMGIDSCIHIQDPALAASDTLVTAKVLAAAAKRIGYDIIFCGQHSTDAETGQVPVELAELLGIPCATAVRKIEYLADHLIQVTSETDEGSVLLEMKLPAVLTAAERLIKPLKTKNADLSAVPPEKIKTIGLAELGLSSDEVGVTASPTWVEDIIDVRVNRSPQILDGRHITVTAYKILQAIGQELERSRPQKNDLPSATITVKNEKQKAFWCWTEFLENNVRAVSLELLSTSRSLAQQTSGTVTAIVAGHLNPEAVNVLASYGADTICTLRSPSGHPDEIIALLEQQIKLENPFALFFPATSAGKYLAPRIAARLNLGLTGDCVGFELTNDGKLAQLKPAFGGNIIAPIFSKTFPQLATVRPGAMEAIRFSNQERPNMISWTLAEDVFYQFTIIAKEIDPGIDAMKLDDAKVVVGIGAGLGQENIRLAERLAELLGGTTGATRRVVDSGWMPRQFQIGLTGKFISPSVYLGLGVSGRYNHMIGVQKSGLIIAINQDAAAEIFQSCDIGVHGDCVAIIREMIRIVESSKE